MNNYHFIIGLPAKTIFLGGGLYLLSMLLPTILVTFLRKREDQNNE
ncbi:hypothetical protein [Fusibacter ferrireducens]|uniref:Uncharacterized protein n=1 Tax=Fusibacter ferrireducens TaxID=2785058 RepID=A0ABR9ZNX2_9FIRM|nr:hypothetical protein [Fusibacter ferrireducens]MBF4692167.1 hypothetical protein [Fusibacter ferrireducens]